MIGLWLNIIALIPDDRIKSNVIIPLSTYVIRWSCLFLSEYPSPCCLETAYFTIDRLHMCMYVLVQQSSSIASFNFPQDQLFLLHYIRCNITNHYKILQFFSLNKAIVEEYCETMPESARFKSYKDLKRHWKNIVSFTYKVPTLCSFIQSNERSYLPKYTEICCFS